MYYVTLNLQAGWFPGNDFHILAIDILDRSNHNGVTIISVQAMKFEITLYIDWFSCKNKKE